uniref:ATP synthase complex subunit 8 n=1 Tax=Periophthalmus cantonensis TaxID=664656 RepID=A0A0E3T9B8_9GOBI|nr:ATP synthase F0 subunit 8 [Periophthalmus cantonensis]
MPQLNPSPGFAILVFSGLTFITIVVPKTLNHTFPNEPSPQTTQITKTNPGSGPG